MAKWEYCAVGPIKGRYPAGGFGDYPKVFFFTASGLVETPIGQEMETGEDDRLAQIIARLGDEGWVLTTSGPVPGRMGEGSLHLLYFKRER